MTGITSTGMNDIKQVLEDLAEGKISKVEAKQLIKTILRRSPRKIRVKVRSKDGKNVNIVVPTGMIKRAINWVGEEVKEEIRNQVDFSKVEEALEDEDFRGEVIEVTGDDGEVVFVSIE